jgi:LPXTG-site transpeptidase (sortase) family protein
MMRRTGTLQTLGTGLLVAGLLLAVMPTFAIHAVDRLTARMREIAAREQLQPRRQFAAAPAAVDSPGRGVGKDAAHPAARARPIIIEPGSEGYLLEIPRLGLRAVVAELEPDVFSGKNTPRLRRFGLGQVPYSDLLKNVSPGAEGTAVIAGHRTTSGAPFRNLHLLGPGDLILIRKGDVEQRWTVVYATTVAPGAIEAIRSEPGTRRLAILACSPPFSDAQRLVVYATPVSEGVP